MPHLAKSHHLCPDPNLSLFGTGGLAMAALADNFETVMSIVLITGTIWAPPLHCPIFWLVRVLEPPCEPRLLLKLIDRLLYIVDKFVFIYCVCVDLQDNSLESRKGG